MNCLSVGLCSSFRSRKVRIRRNERRRRRRVQSSCMICGGFSICGGSLKPSSKAVRCPVYPGGTADCMCCMAPLACSSYSDGSVETMTQRTIGKGGAASDGTIDGASIASWEIKRSVVLGSAVCEAFGCCCSGAPRLTIAQVGWMRE
jgi:hypothetical protein